MLNPLSTNPCWVNFAPCSWLALSICLLRSLCYYPINLTFFASVNCTLWNHTLVWVRGANVRRQIVIAPTTPHFCSTELKNHLQLSLLHFLFFSSESLSYVWKVFFYCLCMSFLHEPISLQAPEKWCGGGASGRAAVLCNYHPNSIRWPFFSFFSISYVSMKQVLCGDAMLLSIQIIICLAVYLEA